MRTARGFCEWMAVDGANRVDEGVVLLGFASMVNCIDDLNCQEQFQDFETKLK